MCKYKGYNWEILVNDNECTDGENISMSCSVGKHEEERRDVAEVTYNYE